MGPFRRQRRDDGLDRVGDHLALPRLRRGRAHRALPAPAANPRDRPAAPRHARRPGPRHRGERRRRLAAARADRPLLRGGRRVRVRQRPRHRPLSPRRRRQPAPLADGAAIPRRRRGRDDHPGPVVITVAFIGYLVAGPLGQRVRGGRRLLADCYLFVVIPAPYFRRFADNPRVRAFVDGVTAAATGAIAGAAFVLGRRALIDWKTVAVAVATWLAFTRVKKLPEPLVILAAGLAGLLLRRP